MKKFIIISIIIVVVVLVSLFYYGTIMSNVPPMGSIPIEE